MAGMMLKMMNPFGSMPSVPGVGGDDKKEDDMTKEEKQEQEKLRLDAVKEQERKRQQRYKKQDEEREGMRGDIRNKYNIEKKANEEEEEEEDEDEMDSFGAGKKKEEVPDDPVSQAKAVAEKGLNDAKNMFGSFFK